MEHRTEEQRRLRQLADSVPSMLAYWDADLRCRFANRAYQDWFGVPGERVVGMTIRELLGEPLFALNEPHIRAALAGEPQVFERAIPVPGGVRHSLAHYLPDVVDGRVAGFMVLVSDVTPIKRAEAALRESERQLRASEGFLDRTGRLARVGGWEYDLRSGVMQWSRQLRELCEVGPDFEPTLDGARTFGPPEGRALSEAAIERALREGVGWSLERPLLTARGRLLWVRTFGEVEHEGGRPARVIGAMQDVTDDRHRREELQREQERRSSAEHHADALDRALQERDELLDVLTHEVRQPLGNALAALQGARSVLAGAGEEVARRLARAQGVMDDVFAQIDNTLAAASLLRCDAPVPRQDVEIDTFVDLTLGDLPEAGRARVRVERDAAVRTASMEMNLLRLALRNVLLNALKYSPPGSPVTLRLTDAEQPLALVVDVIDSGPGVPPDLLPRLFQRGVRGRHPGTPGSGLGLYIVRRVMEVHGGRVELHADRPGAFTVRLVVAQEDPGRT